MKTNRKTKAGISLIVLVITIIVMIILATAIILSLSNSGIISKANKAKTDSDTANLKEYVNTLRAEWELMTQEERVAEGSSAFEDYANKKLEEKGYSKAAVGTDGEVYSNLTESAKSAIKAGIKVGDKVEGYTVTEKSYETSGDENTADTSTNTETDPKPQTLKTDTAVTWKYIGIGEDGSLEIAADVTNTSPKMNLSGKGGYLNGPTELDKVCAALYSVEGKGTAKSMNIGHVIRILGYIGEKGSYYNEINDKPIPTAEAMTIGELEEKIEKTLKGTKTPDGKDIKTYKSDHYYINKTNDTSKMQNAANVELVYSSTKYWLASLSVSANFGKDYARFGVRCVTSTGVDVDGMFYSLGGSYGVSCALRPLVSLASNIQIEKTAEVGVWNIK